MAKFSIILPVKNGGGYVKECVKSILSQTFTDFDLIILDNHSSDGTTGWIKTLTDSRVKHYLSERSLAIEENWKRALGVSKNEFITLIGHDDLLADNYLTVMNELISKYPDASLYQSHFNYIDAMGALIKNCLPMNETESPACFLEKFLKREIDLMGTGFMMRAADYDSIGGIPFSYPNLLFADFELWINLTKKSYLAVAPENCFSFRIHTSTTTISGDDKYYRAFGRFMEFLHSLQTENEKLGQIIREHGAGYILFYCKGLCHRLLRTPRSKRKGLTVKMIIDKCRQHARMLGVENTFKPEKVWSIRLAKVIDSNIVGRSVFLIFKRIYKKPVLK